MMCTREYMGDWTKTMQELQDHDVVKLTSFLDLGDSEEVLKERLEICAQKHVVLCICQSYLEEDVYMGMLQLMKQLEQNKKKMYQEMQQKGIQKALEKKRNGQGNYGRPKIRLPKDFAQQVMECIQSNRPLETYRKKTNLKKSTFYKYVHIVKKNMQYS